MRTEEQEQVETLLSEIELLIASERLQLQFDNSRLARAILTLPQIGIIDSTGDALMLNINDEEYRKFIPKE